MLAILLFCGCACESEFEAMFNAVDESRYYQITKTGDTFVASALDEDNFKRGSPGKAEAPCAGKITSGNSTSCPEIKDGSNYWTNETSFWPDNSSVTEGDTANCTAQTISPDHAAVNILDRLLSKVVKPNETLALSSFYVAGCAGDVKGTDPINETAKELQGQKCGNDGAVGHVLPALQAIIEHPPVSQKCIANKGEPKCEEKCTKPGKSNADATFDPAFSLPQWDVKIGAYYFKKDDTDNNTTFIEKMKEHLQKYGPVVAPLKIKHEDNLIGEEGTGDAEEDGQSKSILENGVMCKPLASEGTTNKTAWVEVVGYNVMTVEEADAATTTICEGETAKAGGQYEFIYVKSPKKISDDEKIEKDKPGYMKVLVSGPKAASIANNKEINVSEHNLFKGAQVFYFLYSVADPDTKSTETPFVYTTDKRGVQTTIPFEEDKYFKHATAEATAPEEFNIFKDHPITGFAQAEKIDVHTKLNDNGAATLILDTLYFTYAWNRTSDDKIASLAGSVAVSPKVGSGNGVLVDAATKDPDFASTLVLFPALLGPNGYVYTDCIDELKVNDTAFPKLPTDKKCAAGTESDKPDITQYGKGYKLVFAHNLTAADIKKYIVQYGPVFCSFHIDTTTWNTYKAKEDLTADSIYEVGNNTGTVGSVYFMVYGWGKKAATETTEEVEYWKVKTTEKVGKASEANGGYSSCLTNIQISESANSDDEDKKPNTALAVGAFFAVEPPYERPAPAPESAAFSAALPFASSFVLLLSFLLL